MLGIIISGASTWVRIIGQWSKWKKCGVTKNNLNSF